MLKTTVKGLWQRLGYRFQRFNSGVPVEGDSELDLRHRFSHARLLHSQGAIAEAQDIYRDILLVEPDHFDSLYHLGIAAIQTGQSELAVSWITKAMTLRPNLATTLYHRGRALQDLGRLSEALEDYEQALLLKPDYLDALNNRGNILHDLHRLEDALTSYEHVLQLQPDFAPAYSNRGIVLQDLGRWQDALASFDQALLIQPDLVQAYICRGNLLRGLNRLDEALACFHQALTRDQLNADTWNNQGVTLLAQKQRDAALFSFDKALALQADFAEAHANRGHALHGLNRLEEALDSYKEALLRKPELNYLLDALIHTQMYLCEWKDFDSMLALYEKTISNSEQLVTAFVALSLLDRPDLHLKIAIRGHCKKNGALGLIAPRIPREKIRIGYFSANFHNHAVAYLIAELFELHDRSRFTIYGFSFGPEVQDEMQMRICAAVDHFISVEEMQDQEIAQLARDYEIDIAVDLMGFTEDARMGIFSHRCAPLQVSYLGYPGTTGTNYMDYIIADQTVLPSQHQHYYTEKVIYMPNCFQVNDRKRPISHRPLSRREFNLPNTDIVYCCFNNSYKILPSVFDSWMRILQAVPNSALWLSKYTPTAVENLRHRAQLFGISSTRLVFAERISNLDEHLARYRMADLFLDTRPYGAHTTASDALWAGLPVITCMGKSYASRVAASLLQTLGLNELITDNPEKYESLAIFLGRNPDRLAALRKKLEINRQTMPLFNSQLFANNIESAFGSIYARAASGLEPESLHISPNLDFLKHQKNSPPHHNPTSSC